MTLPDRSYMSVSKAFVDLIYRRDQSMVGYMMGSMHYMSTFLVENDIDLEAFF